MSITEMIKEHPDVGADWNERLGEAVRHTMHCAAICNSCADACSAEEMDMAACIRTCIDCADICTATMRVAMRRTAGNVAVIEAQLRACITACEQCADECARHDTAHCRRCAQICRECAEDCLRALNGMMQHG